MDAAGGDVLVESRSTLMGVMPGLRVVGNVSITLGGGTVVVVERVFFCGGVMVGGLVVSELRLVLERGGGGLRVNLVEFLICLGGRALVMC